MVAFFLPPRRCDTNDEYRGINMSRRKNQRPDRRKLREAVRPQRMRWRVGTRGEGDIDTGSDHLGFRCVKDGGPVASGKGQVASEEK